MDAPHRQLQRQLHVLFTVLCNELQDGLPTKPRQETWCRSLSESSSFSSESVSETDSRFFEVPDLIWAAMPLPV